MLNSQRGLLKDHIHSHYATKQLLQLVNQSFQTRTMKPSSAVDVLFAPLYLGSVGEEGVCLAPVLKL